MIFSAGKSRFRAVFFVMILCLRSLRSCARIIDTTTFRKVRAQLMHNSSFAQTPSFRFSIVTAVYNAESFLRETLDSILAQDIGFEEHVQLILVDDGSPDGSGAVCDEYHALYPGNIAVIHQENGGVAAARNAGLTLAAGRYINFLDSDDKLSPETLSLVYDFFVQHEEETDVVSIPMYFFDAQRGPHWQNFKFAGGSRVVDLTQECAVPLMTTSASFYTRACLPLIHFDGRLPIAEDTKINLTILQQKQTLGLVREARYYYRRRSQGSDSLIQGSTKKKSWYLDYMTHFVHWAFRDARAKFGFVPRYVQYTVMADLQWRFKETSDPAALLSPQEIAQYHESLFAALREIDDDILLVQRHLKTEQRCFVLAKKYGHVPQMTADDAGDIYLHFGETQAASLRDIHAALHFFTETDSGLLLEGNIQLLYGCIDAPVEIFLSAGGKTLPCEIVRRSEPARALGETILQHVFFRCILPPDLAECGEIRLAYRCAGREISVRSLRFGKHFPIGGLYRNDYCVLGGRLLTARDGALRLRRAAVLPRLVQEGKMLWELGTRKKLHNRKAALSRLLCAFVRPFLRREIWLISDRANKADDNGEALFLHLQKHPQKKVHPVFVIRRDSPDYARLAQLGAVTDFQSHKHKILFLLAKKNISSHADEFVINPFERAELFAAYRGMLTQQRYVFLQHGVTQNDLTDWLNRYKKNIALFVAATAAEHESLLRLPYFYTEQKVKLLGFPRYDRLYRDERRCITLMPTWRQHLTVALGGGQRAPGPDFAESEYFQFYNQLISHPALLDCAQKHGYTLRFLPHPTIVPAMELFAHDPRVTFLTGKEAYREIFAQSELVLTDYSSVAFDFAYLRKPVVYSQFDKAALYSGGHLFTGGCFDYERDGFGEVEYTLEGTAARLMEYIEKDCALKEEYRERIDQTFPFSDRENCARCVNEVLKLR